jgi:hypothetical protein
MKVKVVEGYQIVDPDGEVHTSGTVEVDDVEGRSAIAAGYAEEVGSKKAPPAQNKKAPEPSSDDGGKGSSRSK